MAGLDAKLSKSRFSDWDLDRTGSYYGDWSNTGGTWTSSPLPSGSLGLTGFLPLSSALSSSLLTITNEEKSPEVQELSLILVAPNVLPNKLPPSGTASQPGLFATKKAAR